MEAAAGERRRAAEARRRAISQSAWRCSGEEHGFWRPAASVCASDCTEVQVMFRNLREFCWTTWQSSGPICQVARLQEWAPGSRSRNRRCLQRLQTISVIRAQTIADILRGVAAEGQPKRHNAVPRHNAAALLSSVSERPAPEPTM